MEAPNRSFLLPVLQTQSFTGVGTSSLAHPGAQQLINRLLDALNSSERKEEADIPYLYECYEKLEAYCLAGELKLPVRTAVRIQQLANEIFPSGLCECTLAHTGKEYKVDSFLLNCHGAPLQAWGVNGWTDMSTFASQKTTETILQFIKTGKIGSMKGFCLDELLELMEAAGKLELNEITAKVEKLLMKRLPDQDNWYKLLKAALAAHSSLLRDQVFELIEGEYLGVGLESKDFASIQIELDGTTDSYFILKKNLLDPLCQLYGRNNCHLQLSSMGEYDDYLLEFGDIIFEIEFFFYKEMTDDFLRDCVSKCPQLTYLSIEGGKKITDTGLKTIASLKHLKELCLSDCPQIKTPDLTVMNNLTFLNLRFCSALKVLTGAERLEGLSALSVTECPSLSLSFPSPLKSLTELKLYGTIQEMVLDLDSFPALERVEVDDSQNLVGIQSAVPLPRLKECDIRSCTNLSSLPLDKMLQLEILSISGCTGLTADSIQGVTLLEELKVLRMRADPINVVDANLRMNYLPAAPSRGHIFFYYDEDEPPEPESMDTSLPAEENLKLPESSIEEVDQNEYLFDGETRWKLLSEIFEKRPTQALALYEDFGIEELQEYGDSFNQMVIAQGKEFVAEHCEELYDKVELVNFKVILRWLALNDPDLFLKATPVRLGDVDLQECIRDIPALEYLEGIQISEEEVLYTKGEVEEIDIPLANESTRVDDLLGIFDRTDFSPILGSRQNPQENGERTLSYYRQNLETLVANITYCKKCTGVPVGKYEREQFYSWLANVLKLAIELMQSSENSNLTAHALLELAEASIECGPRWKREILHVFMALSGKRDIQYDQESMPSMFHKWFDLRKEYTIDFLSKELSELDLKEEGVAYEPHYYNFIAYAAKEKGVALPSHALLGIDDEFLEDVEILRTQESAYDEFLRFFTTVGLVNYFKEQIEATALNNSAFVATLRCSLEDYIEMYDPEVNQAIQRLQEEKEKNRVKFGKEELEYQCKRLQRAVELHLEQSQCAPPQEKKIRRSLDFITGSAKQLLEKRRDELLLEGDELLQHLQKELEALEFVDEERVVAHGKERAANWYKQKREELLGGLLDKKQFLEVTAESLVDSENPQLSIKISYEGVVALMVLGNFFKYRRFFEPLE